MQPSQGRAAIGRPRLPSTDPAGYSMHNETLFFTSLSLIPVRAETGIRLSATCARPIRMQSRARHGATQIRASRRSARSARRARLRRAQRRRRQSRRPSAQPGAVRRRATAMHVSHAPFATGLRSALRGARQRFVTRTMSAASATTAWRRRRTRRRTRRRRRRRRPRATAATRTRRRSLSRPSAQPGAVKRRATAKCAILALVSNTRLEHSCLEFAPRTCRGCTQYVP